MTMQTKAQTKTGLLRKNAELAKAHAAVATERERLHNVLERLPAYVVLLTPDYHVPFANRFFRERFGEARGRRCHEYLFNRTTPCEVCESFKVLKTRAAHRWKWTGPDGRHYDIHDFPFTDVDGSPLIMEVGLDTTDRERAEAALQQMNETLEKRVTERTAELRESEARCKLLSDVAGRLLAADNPQAMVNELCAEVMAHLDCQVFFNYVADPLSGRLHLNACAGIPAREARDLEWLEYGAGICGWVARDACRIVAENIPETPDPRTDLVRSLGIRAYACQPLLARDRVIGTLSFGTKDRMRFAPDELALMKTVADQVALAMERVRAQSEIAGLNRKLEHRVAELETVLNTAPIGLAIADDATGQHIRGNRATEEMFGVPPGGELAKKGLAAARFRVFQEGRELPADALPMQRAIRGETISGMVMEAVREDGQKLAVYASSRPLFDEQNRPRGAVGAFLDITPLQQAEAALRKINEQLEQRVLDRTAELHGAYRYARSLLEASLDPLVVISPDGKVTDVNKASEEVTGTPRERLIGSNFTDYFTEPEKAQAGYRKVLAEGWVRDYPLTIRHATGRATEVLYNATLYRNEAGETQGVFAAARDITERKRLEEAQAELFRRLSEAQETERGRISRELHDCLGQDLTALKLGLQMLRQRGPFAADVQSDLGRLERLVDGLARDIHRLAWELRPTVLDDLGLEAALRRYSAEWSETSGVAVDFHSRGLEKHRLPLELETTLYRVAQEALTNVLRHARARRVSILLERRRDRVSLIVEDDGAGFDVEAAVQAPGPQGKLGLLGMQERVALAGGTLQIESSPGAGTTLFVRVPQWRRNGGPRIDDGAAEDPSGPPS